MKILAALLLTAPLCASLSDDTAELVKDHTSFAFSLYPTLDTDSSLVFSPYSVATCLSMVYVGARGETESQMERALHLEVDRKDLGKASNALTQSLMPRKDEYKLNFANALWIDQGTSLLAQFSSIIEGQFKANLSVLDFTQTQSALDQINGWTSTQTQGKIPNLLQPNDINGMTRLVLTNALYFQGSWANAFDPKKTTEGKFYPTPDTTSTAQFMRKTLSIPYYENDLMQAAALPFQGGSLAFLVLLPKSADNFTAMFNELPDTLSDWIGSLSPQSVDLKLPKFSLKNRFDLNGPLEQLGMEDAFGPEANFLGIDGMRDLFLNKVVHEAYFDLDESGVVAAAATGASMNVTAVQPKEAPVVLTADHPFLFFIVDMKSQELLFMGKLAQPGAAS